MARNSGQRLISVLDWLWPFPLGLFVVSVLFIVPFGIWLTTRPTRPSRTGPPAEVHTANASTAPAPEAIPPPAATPLPPKPDLPKPESSAPPTKALKSSSPLPDRPAAPKLSAKQQADINDHITIGRFMMERKDYAKAIESFQAALNIDPSNRKAREALQEARRASLQSNTAANP